MRWVLAVNVVVSWRRQGWSNGTSTPLSPLVLDNPQRACLSVSFHSRACLLRRRLSSHAAAPTPPPPRSTPRCCHYHNATPLRRHLYRQLRTSSCLGSVRRAQQPLSRLIGARGAPRRRTALQRPAFWRAAMACRQSGRRLERIHYTMPQNEHATEAAGEAARVRYYN